MILITCGSRTGYAQYIDLEITIESELSTSVEQNLDFGKYARNAGKVSIAFGDQNMGIVGIRALKNQNLFIEFIPPAVLKSVNSDNTYTVPVSLSIDYDNSGENNINNARPLKNNQEWIIILPDKNSNRNSHWKSIYLYIFGSLNIENIPEDIYEGYALLIVNYE